MTDDGTPPKELPAEPADAPAAPTWEAALQRAARPEESAIGGHSAPRPARTAAWQPWLRAAAPLLIVLAYLGWKAWSARDARDAAGPGVENVQTLSGVRPPEEKIRTDRATEDFLKTLESLREARRWGEVARAVAAAPPEIAGNPVVKAFGAVARSFEGAAIPREELRSLRTRLAGDSQRQALVDYLKIAEARTVLLRTRTPENMLANMDAFRELLAGQPVLTPELLELRIQLASRFEELGDAEAEAARATFRKDRPRLVVARSFYQNGLRWVTTPDGWIDARPVAEGKAALVADRILDKLRTANEDYHGMAIPWGDRDASTWTGAKGDPVHDSPTGRW